MIFSLMFALKCRRAEIVATVFIAVVSTIGVVTADKLIASVMKSIKYRAKTLLTPAINFLPVTMTLVINLSLVSFTQVNSLS